MNSTLVTHSSTIKSRGSQDQFRLCQELRTMIKIVVRQLVKGAIKANVQELRMMIKIVLKQLVNGAIKVNVHP